MTFLLLAGLAVVAASVMKLYYTNNERYVANIFDEEGNSIGYVVFEGNQPSFCKVVGRQILQQRRMIMLSRYPMTLRSLKTTHLLFLTATDPTSYAYAIYDIEPMEMASFIGASVIVTNAGTTKIIGQGVIGFMNPET